MENLVCVTLETSAEEDNIYEYVAKTFRTHCISDYQIHEFDCLNHLPVNIVEGFYLGLEIESGFQNEAYMKQV